MRSGLARTLAATVLAVLGVYACSPQVSLEPPAPEPPPRGMGNDGYSLPDTPFTREGTVVTATCLMGARYASVSVEAWDAREWTPLAERSFALPTNAAFSNYPGAKPVNSALIDLCRQSADNPSPYGVDALEQVTPRVRALFDLGFTRMAVVLRDPRSDATHAGFVEDRDVEDEFVRLSDATSADEQNAVMAPDGRSVWFTYTTSSGEARIGSRAAHGDHRLSDEGPAAGHDLPLAVSGKPPLAVQADMVRVSPQGGRVTARAPKVFGTVFDAPRASAHLTGKSARNATLVRDCVGIVGWIDDTRVLCRTASGAFRRMDTRSGRAVGGAVDVVGPNDGMAAEGMLVSPDGTQFVVSVHLPNDPYALFIQGPDLRVVPTTPGGETARLSHNRLSVNTFFLEWR